MEELRFAVERFFEAALASAQARADLVAAMREFEVEAGRRNGKLSKIEKALGSRVISRGAARKERS
jgi:hypothetical protein